MGESLEGVVPRGDRHSARHAVLVHDKAAGDACDVSPGDLRGEALQGQAGDFIVLAVGGVRGEGDGVAVGGIRPPPLAAVQEDGLAFHELKHGALLLLELVISTQLFVTRRQSQHGVPLECGGESIQQRGTRRAGRSHFTQVDPQHCPGQRADKDVPDLRQGECLLVAGGGAYTGGHAAVNGVVCECLVEALAIHIHEHCKGDVCIPGGVFDARDGEALHPQLELSAGEVHEGVQAPGQVLEHKGGVVCGTRRL